MADKKAYSALTKNTYTIPAGSVYTVDYLDTKPNYFRVQNQGTTALYCATGFIPKLNKYDFVAPAGGMKLYAEPFRQSRLYVFNPSTENVRCTVLSFTAEFDPLTLALSDMELDLSGTTLEANTVISGFSSPLPNGYNNIGTVNGSSVYVDEIHGIDDIVVEKFRTQTGESLTYLSNNADTAAEKSTSNVKYVNFISNDSDTDSISVYLGTSGEITLKAGEVINDIYLKDASVRINGKKYRCLVQK